MSDSTLTRQDSSGQDNLLIRDDLSSPLERFAIRPGLRFWIFSAALLVIALIADTMVQSWITPEQAAWNKSQSRLWIVAKQPGEWWVLAVACVLVSRLHAWRWRSAAVLILGVMVAGVITWFMKWATGRIRPKVDGSQPFAFDPGLNGLHGLFNQVNLSFPSGHATMAFALAAGLTFFAPRAWWVWAAMASMTAAERIAQKAHWPSDVVAGMIVGVIGFRLALWCCLAATHQPLRESIKRPRASNQQSSQTESSQSAARTNSARQTLL